MTYEIQSLGGNCPVQAEGIIDGLPFYFRSRGERWSFSVASSPDGDPVDVSCGMDDGGFYYAEEYGTGERFSAGYISEDQARDFIAKAAKLYENRI